MRKFDAITLLYNLTYDVRRMLDEGQNPKDVTKHIQKKIEFLKNPPPGNKVSW